MARITIQFSHPTDDSSFALIPVEVSDARGNIIHRQAVPLSTNAQLSAEFKPGSYLVRGTLPSGDFAVSTVDLSTVSSAVAMLRAPILSPRESLSWAYYLQRAPARSSRRTEQSSIFDLSEIDQTFSVPSPATTFWRHDAGSGWTRFPVEPSSPRQGYFSYVNFDSTVQAQEPDAVLFIELNSQLPWQFNIGQFWIQVASGIHSQFVAVPPTEKMRIFILKHKSINDLDPPFRVIVGSGSPTLQSLVGFLNSGDFDSARSVGDEWLDAAEKMLQDKLMDAVSAAVAGYFLLRVGEHSRLHNWTRNLAEWIAWLPDGPVIRAYHLLSQDEPDLGEVRQRLLEAASRGVPLYTEGLRMLYDGLHMMNTRAQGDDPQLQRAFETIRQYAATARWKSPVTSFAAFDPSRPQLPQLSVPPAYSASRSNEVKSMALTTEDTNFTHDILGRYVCNTFAEAKSSGTFDVVIIGGGTFGLTLAQDLFERSRPLGPAIKPGNYRVLILEGGPFTLPEHVQDLPSMSLPSPGPVQADPLTFQDTPSAPRMLSTGNALPATRLELIISGLDKQPVFENWGMPWNSSVRFGGLAYCLGGRSLYFGGWSPRYLATEMETAPVDPMKSAFPWPQTVVDDLKARYFLEAARQTGASTSNDYIAGKMHNFFREKLFKMYSTIPNVVPLNELPDYATEAPEDMGQGIKDILSGAVPPPYVGFQNSLRLDAPLAVQILSRPGFFPFNKFSSVPLGIAAARRAFADANDKLGNTDKRLMIVPNCHVKGLRTRSYMVATGANVQEIDGIYLRTKDGGDDFLDLSGAVQGNIQRRPVIILAMGAIESARMALLTAGIASAPNGGLVGNNLMVHLRKNSTFTVTIPPSLTLTDLELTALLVRCRAKVNGAFAHYHFQISASALSAGSGAGSSDALLFQNIPDLDNLRHFETTAPGEIDVSIRAVGEILPNPQSSVIVPTAPGQVDLDEALVPRATATLVPRTSAGNDIELQVMTLMNQGIDFLAKNLFGAAPGPKYTPAANVNPDGLGTTFHESGTLRMGDDPAKSVVNPDSQFHFVTNLYAGDAAVLPTCGSSNPVMNGVAIRRRLARRLVPEGDAGQPLRPFVQYPPPGISPPTGTVIKLFDGTSFANWRMSGRGTFHVIDGAFQSVPSFDLGMLWCTIPMPQNYILELEFFIRTFQTNSGVFVRFRNPDSVLAPDGTPFSNPAWSAVYTGFEIQIDNSGAGQPTPGMAIHRTGAVYAVSYPGNVSEIVGFPAATPGDFVTPQDASVLGWNQYSIEVSGNVIKVALNGTNTAKYTIPDPAVVRFPAPYDQSRGRFPATEPTFIGLQSYSNYGYTTAFRNIRMTVL